MKNLLLTLLFSYLLVHAQSVFSQQHIIVSPAVICAGNIGSFQLSAPQVPYSKTVIQYTFLYSNGDSTITLTPSTSRLFTGGNWSIRAKVHFTDGTTLAIDSTAFPVYHRPIPGFSLTTPRAQCLGTPFCFQNASKQNPLQPSNPIANEIWEFGDATYDSIPAGLPVICHTFSFPGVFPITQRVIDTKGCVADSITKHDSSLVVLPSLKPEFSWTGTAQCFGSTYTFRNKTPNFLIANLKQYTWDFGDSNTYSASAPFSQLQLKMLDSIPHTYTGNGSFIPKLSITDSLGCSSATDYTQQHSLKPLPLNTNIDSIILSSKNQFIPLNEKYFCAGDGDNQVYFSHNPIPLLQPGTGDFLWDFDDPSSQSQNVDIYHFNPSHVFRSPGMYIVSFKIQNQHPSCNIHLTDTITIKGPLARIEDIAANSTVVAEQKFQIDSKDTVDFVNNTLAYQNSKLRFVWDFDDEFAPQCTSYSIPNPSFSGPFTDAAQQYANSTHYYRRGGITYTGKMNCRWSLDSLPRHLYTNWDSVYQWYISGKTFPTNWDLGSIYNNSPITIAPPGIPDPFLQAMGIIANIPEGYTINGPSGSLSYTIPDKGFYTHSGMQLLPNSAMTFHEYLFLYSKVHGFHVKLMVNDSTNITPICSSSDELVISHGKPDARGMGISGKICSGASPNGVRLQFGPFQNTPGIKPDLGRTVLLINFDSLADRKDNTPCNLDGFVGYEGGTTTGGLNIPPFSSAPNFFPIHWQNAAQNSLFFHYGPNAPGNRPPPADSLNGYVTIGVIVGTGCANPPLCNQALQYSDTIWYHNLFNISKVSANYTTQQPDGLKAKSKTYTYTPKQPFLSDVKWDTWDWGDKTLTVDSFWYADTSVTNEFYTNGFRRVRYNYAYGAFGSLILNDSLPFPFGLPRTPGKFYLDTTSRQKLCNQPDTSYATFIKDSAQLLLPVSHKFSVSSFEHSYNPSNPNTNSIVRQTGSINGCTQAYVIPQTIGIINTIQVENNPTKPDSIFCLNDEISLSSFTRYFRYDNQNTELPFNPGRSFNQVYDPPFDALNYDTINFWQRDLAQTGDIETVRFNPVTNKSDTVYYEKLLWDFGDGSALAKGLKVKHRYVNGGHYSLKMITRDSIGNYDTAYKNIYISAPKARIDFLRDALNNPVNVFNCGSFATVFDSSGIGNINGEVVDSIKINYWWTGEHKRDTLKWDFFNNFNPVIAYRNNGFFRVKLVSESYLGCKDTAYTTLFVKGPRPAFKLLSPVEGCSPYTIKILDQTDIFRKVQPPIPNDTPTRSVTYDWGDGTTSLLPHRLDTLIHTYSQSGIFNITAVASDAPAGTANNCKLVSYPDTLFGEESSIFTKVADLSFDTITGKIAPTPNESVTYQITPTPAATYIWKVTGGILVSGNGTPAITVEWPTKGIFTIIATKLLYGCSHTETLTVSVFPTGLEKTHTETHFTLYPNPSRGVVNIDFIASETKEMTISIYDILGKECFTDRFTSTNGNNTKTYSIQKFRSGLYFIEMTTSSGKTTQKFQIE